MGPVSFYQSLGGSRARRYSGGTVTQQRQALAQARAADKVEQARQLNDALQAILSLHRTEFAPASAPVAPLATVPSRESIQKQFRKQALKGVGWFKFKARSAAKASATQRAESEYTRVVAQAEMERAEEQRQLDRLWELLLANDEDVTIATLTEAFSDNEAGAVAVSVTGDSVALVVQLPDLSAVPERKATTTDLGNLSIKKMTKTERNATYGALAGGHILLTVKEAFAVAPGLARAQVIGIRPERTDAYGKLHLECILAGVWERTAFEGVDWNSSCLTILTDTPSTLLSRATSTHELKPLNLSTEPDLAALLAAIDLSELSHDAS